MNGIIHKRKNRLTLHTNIWQPSGKYFLPFFFGKMLVLKQMIWRKKHDLNLCFRGFHKNCYFAGNIFTSRPINKQPAGRQLELFLGLASSGLMQGASFCCPTGSANERGPGLGPTNGSAAPDPGSAPASRAANTRQPGGQGRGQGVSGGLFWAPRNHCRTTNWW